MPDIRDQLAWERRMIGSGISRYRNQQDKAVEGGRAHDTSAGTRLLRSYIIQVSDHLRAYLDGKHPGGRRRSQYAKLIATIDTDKTALFALKEVISTLYKPQTTQTVCGQIGREMESEIRFAKFQTEHKEYYDEIIRSWERKHTTNSDHKRRTLNVKSRDLGVEWEDWGIETRIKIGALVISLLMEVCDLVETRKVAGKRGSTLTYLVPSEQCIKWVSDHNALSELAAPDRMPCIIPPEDWTDWRTGGYYNPRMRMKTPMVKVRSFGHGITQSELLDEADLSKVMKPLNALQRTGWKVNRRVLEVMKEVWSKNLGVGMPPSQPYEMPKAPIPDHIKASELPEDSSMAIAFSEWKQEMRELYTLERERIAKNLSISRTIRVAVDMQEYDDFYYVYTCDFRGRVYATASGLSPQGTDHGKALLQFSEAKPLGPRGLYWLKVHGANKWGEDKSSYDDRVAWIEERHDDWLRVADDPINHRSIWADADKPYQFLAFCFEYAQAVEVGEQFRSSLPIALDGSCNGLQHFSAMLRDEVGGRAVNLVPGDKPEDIYQEVADVCTDKLRRLRLLNDEHNAGASNWLAGFKKHSGEEAMKRALPKKPVMTLPYGSTQQACTSTIYKWSLTELPGFFDKGTEFRHALYLSPKLWASIGDVVVAARAAMDWIQGAAGEMAKQGHPISYTTPLGFPVHQGITKYTTRLIETQIGGRLQLRCAKSTSDLDSRKQRQGSSPNFVHSVDATHMLMCVDAGEDAGISHFACIHDDFGVHACDTDQWQGIIRTAFVALHSDNDLLADFKKVHEDRHDLELPDLPSSGTLDIHEVLRSPYFFG